MQEITPDKYSALDVLKMKRLSSVEKIWITAVDGFIPDFILRKLSLWCAEQALSYTKEEDSRFVNVIKAWRDFEEGKITEKINDSVRHELGGLWDITANPLKDFCSRSVQDLARYAAVFSVSYGNNYAIYTITYMVNAIAYATCPDENRKKWRYAKEKAKRSVINHLRFLIEAER